MRTARARQAGHLLAVLLVLLGVGAAVAPSAEGTAGEHRVSVMRGSLSPVPSMHDDLQDWLRLSAGTPRAPATALPDTWWAVFPGATGAATPPACSLVVAVDRTATSAATPTGRSSRAPPLT